MRTRSATFEELQFISQIPSRESANFLRGSGMFAEAFARTLPLVFGPLIIQQWTVDGAWAEASRSWGIVCSAYSTGILVGTEFGKFSLRRRMRISQLQTPLLDSHLVRAAKTVADEAGASFLVLGLIGLALSILAIGGSRSVPVFGAARAASGFFAGALVSRWDPKLMERPREHSSFDIGSDHGFEKSPRRRRRSRGSMGPMDSPVCSQANSATWLTGFTFGPLLGIFFQQRAFSRWKATLKLPSRVKALPEKTRQLFPALAPCIGGAIVLVLVALFVVCETGIRLLKCDRIGKKCQRCMPSCCGKKQAPSSSSGVSASKDSSDEQPSSSVARCVSSLASLVCLPCTGLGRVLSYCSPRDAGRNGAKMAASKGLSTGEESERLLMIDDEDGSDSSGDEESFRFERTPERFLTANDCEFSDDSEHALGSSSHHQAANRERLPTQELSLDYAKRSAAMRPQNFSQRSTSNERSGAANNEDDARWPDFVAAFGESKAASKFEAMLAWRRSSSIDNIMDIEHPKFFVFKKAYPFYIHGRSKTGEIVTYENPGKMNLSHARTDGCTPQALRGILSCIYEYVSLLEREHQESLLEHGDVNRRARMMTVVDVSGLSVANLNQDTFAFMLTAGDIMDNYYPERVKRICIVNAPFWFTGAWKGISALLPTTITDKVQISGIGQTMEQLLRFIDPKELPSDYIESGSGVDPKKNLALSQHPQEHRLCDIVNKTLERGRAAAADTATVDGETPSTPAHGLSPPPPPPPLPLTDVSGLGGGEPNHRRTHLGRTQSQQQTTTAAAPSSSSSLPTCSVRRTISSPDFSQGADSSGVKGAHPTSWNPFSGLFTTQSSRHAHMGDENKFVYDRMKGEWVLHQTSPVLSGGDGTANMTMLSSTDGTNSDGRNKTMTSESAVRMSSLDEQGGFEELLEQHAITLAIQAAHLAAEWQRVGHLPEARSNESMSRMLLGTPPSSLSNSFEPLRRMNEGGDHPSRSPRGASNKRRLVWLLLALHASWTLVHLTLETVVPLWMFSTPNKGGLGFEPVDAALVFGFVGCVMLMLKSFTPTRLKSLPLHAPLRALRVAVGILTVLALAASWVPAAELHKPRNESVMVWVLVTVLLSGLAAAVILGRSATAVMMQVAVGSEQVSPESKQSVYRAEAAVESTAPVIAAFVFAWSFDQGMRFPMDASFCFNGLAVLGLGLYTVSLVLHVNVVGDFGTAPEGAAVNLGRGGLCCPRLDPHRCPCATKCVNGLICLEEILVLPATDVSTLIVDAKHELGLAALNHGLLTPPSAFASTGPTPVTSSSSMLPSSSPLSGMPYPILSSTDNGQSKSTSMPHLMPPSNSSPSSPASGGFHARGQQRQRSGIGSSKEM